MSAKFYNNYNQLQYIYSYRSIFTRLITAHSWRCWMNTSIVQVSLMRGSSSETAIHYSVQLLAKIWLFLYFRLSGERWGVILLRMALKLLRQGEATSVPNDIQRRLFSGLFSVGVTILWGLLPPHLTFLSNQVWPFFLWISSFLLSTLDWAIRPFVSLTRIDKVYVNLLWRSFCDSHYDRESLTDIG